MTRARVVVIGAGVAGLAAAAALDRAGVEVEVVEAGPTVGGRVRTVVVEGTEVDVGAQFLAPVPSGLLAAVDVLGLGGDLHRRRQHAAVVHAGRAWPLTDPRQVLRSRLLPRRSRLGVALLGAAVGLQAGRLDPLDLTRARALDDASADAYVRRWAGAAAADRFVGPVVRALLYWDLRSTSRAVLMAMLRMAVRHRHVHVLTGGLGRLTDAMAAGLGVHVDAEVVGIERGGATAPWTVWTRDGRRFTGAGIVCATTATVAARLTEPLVPASSPTRRYLDAVSYTRTVGVVVRVAPGRPPPATTLVFTDEHPLLASVDRASPVGEAGPTLATIFLSDAGARHLGALDDGALAAATLDATRAAAVDGRWLDHAEPVAVTRWDEALPRFDVGALRAPARGDPATIDLDGLVFAGDHLGGPWLGGAHASGEAAARRLLARLPR